MTVDQANVAVIGLGYVGLPLLLEFSKHLPTLGYDINTQRINELETGLDSTNEFNQQQVLENPLQLTDDPKQLAQSNVYIVTVPTPVDEFKKPDFRPLLSATETISYVLNKGDIVIFESTVYPGASEELCVPILEQNSKLEFNKDFFVGYSPERINPGDRKHQLHNVMKIVAGSNTETLDFIDQFYRLVVKAGTYKVASLKIAEAAKVIENTQRDINIALINELALIFDRLGLDSQSVLDAAGTKWNFLPFKPGLVGGHCIDVDPYYLTYKAQQIGYHPEVILAGRRINDSMGTHVANKVAKIMVHKSINPSTARALVLGCTFKENCADLRNTGVKDVIDELNSWGITVDIFDPWVNIEEAKNSYDFTMITELSYIENLYDVLVLAVAHDQFKLLEKTTIERLVKNNRVIFDVKSLWPQEWVDARL